MSGEPAPTTLIALGASNLTRGFATVVNTARRLWGDPIDVFAALGFGRSYGIRSRVLFRHLPSIIECGLWRELEARPRGRLRAVIADIGNDILYDVMPDTILSWVRECVTRLQTLGAETTITSLPLDSIRRLTELRYLSMRSILFPRCRLDLAETLSRCEEVDAGVAVIARQAKLTLVRLRPEWYGFDPIHVRLRFWQSAWKEILLGTADATTEPRVRPVQPIGGLRLYFARPQQQWLFDVERRYAQPALRTDTGTRVWLY